MDTLLQDIRYALRSLARSPGFTAVAVVTLALGIGANTAIFSVVNGVLLRPLGYRDPDRLMVLWETRGEVRTSVTAPDYADWLASTRSFAQLAAVTDATVNLTGGVEPERLVVRRVSSNYFTTLGVAPQLGRTFTAEEEGFGAARATVLADGYWRRRFGADPGVLGRSVLLGGEPYTVIGVMPRGFPDEGAVPLWVPLALTPEERSSTGSHLLTVIGRLGPGATRSQAEVELRGIAEQLARTRPGSNEGVSVRVQGLQQAIVGDSRRALLVLLGAVGLVLLLACANVANLLVARLLARRREMSIRAALGASRGRLGRQLLTESLVLAVSGGGLGLGFALWGKRLLVALLPVGVPRLAEASIDAPVLVFTAAVAVLTAVLFGLAPALLASRANLQGALAEGGRGALGPTRHATRSALVAGQIAVALVLLAGAGLLLRSFLALRAVAPGFDPRHVVALHLTLPGARYAGAEAVVGFYESVLDRMRGLPGVRSAALTSQLPLDDMGWSLSTYFPDRPPVAPSEVPSVFVRTVSPEYLRTTGIRLLRGRDLGRGTPPAHAQRSSTRPWLAAFGPAQTRSTRRLRWTMGTRSRSGSWA